MAGILDKKARSLDVVITNEGRKKISRGQFRPSFFSFSDGDVSYGSDTSFVLEAASSASDVITVEASGDGHLIIDAGALRAGGGIVRSLEGEELTSEQAYSVLETIQGRTFNDLSILKTVDESDSEFSLSPTKAEFTLSADSLPSKDIDKLPGMFEDVRFRNSLNFLHLPPVNKKRAGVSKLLGNYPDTIRDGKSLEDFILDAQRSGLVTTLKFGYSEGLQSRFLNDALIQVYETEAQGSVRKLDTYDLGVNLIGGERKRIFVSGYEELDSRNVSTFSAIFYFMWRI